MTTSTRVNKPEPFKVGELVEGKRTGNVLLVTSDAPDDDDSERFGGVIIHTGINTLPSDHIGYANEDWAMSQFTRTESGVMLNP